MNAFLRGQIFWDEGRNKTEIASGGNSKNFGHRFPVIVYCGVKQSIGAHSLFDNLKVCKTDD